MSCKVNAHTPRPPFSISWTSEGPVLTSGQWDQLVQQECTNMDEKEYAYCIHALHGPSAMVTQGCSWYVYPMSLWKVFGVCHNDSHWHVSSHPLLMIQCHFLHQCFLFHCRVHFLLEVTWFLLHLVCVVIDSMSPITSRVLFHPIPMVLKGINHYYYYYWSPPFFCRLLEYLP